MLEKLDEMLESGEVIARKAVCTLSGGYKQIMTVIAPPEDFNRGRDYELWYVKMFNKTQPHLKNKMVDIHILRK